MRKRAREGTGETVLYIHIGKSELFDGNFDDTSLTSLRNKVAVPASDKRYVPHKSMLTHVCDTAGKGSRSNAVSGHWADGRKAGGGGGGAGAGGEGRGGGVVITPPPPVTMDMPPDVDGPDGRTLEQMFELVL